MVIHHLNIQLVVRDHCLNHNSLAVIITATRRCLSFQNRVYVYTLKTMSWVYEVIIHESCVAKQNNVFYIT